MGLIYLILVIAILLIMLLFIFAVRIKLVFDSYETRVYMTLLWLEPFIKARIVIGNYKPMIAIYLFNMRIYKNELKKMKAMKKKDGNIRLVKFASTTDVNIYIKYGFKDPFITGITCGAINMASQFLNIDSFVNFPDFITEDDYIYFDATANINIGKTFIKLIGANA